MNLLAKKWGRVARLFHLASALAVPFLPLLSSGDSARDSKIKAGFTNHFILFGTWPESAFQRDPDSFTVGIIGAPDIYNFFKDIEDQTVNDRKIKIRHLPPHPSKTDIADCQIIFIGEDSALEIKNILSLTKGAPILTVSDAESFVQQGGMIEFSTRRNRIKFNIHRGRATKVGIHFRAQMLKMAGHVWEDE